MVRAIGPSLASRPDLSAELKKSTAFLYKPYSYFTELEDDDYPGSSMVKVVEVLIRRGRYDEAREASAKLIAGALAGLRYLET